jgi:hypothetical protein
MNITKENLLLTSNISNNNSNILIYDKEKEDNYINIKKIKETYEKNSKSILSCIYWLLFFEYIYRTIRNFFLR